MYYRFKHIHTPGNPNGKRYSYIYLCESVWIPSQGSRQKVIKYIGKANGYEPYLVEEIFKRDGYHCNLCKKEEDLIIDHIIPTTKGGTNESLNLQVLCKQCNFKKGKKIL